MGSTTGRAGPIAGYYGLTGVLNALWGATLPATEDRLDLGAGRLGGVLLTLAVGVLVAMPVTGSVAGRSSGRWSGRRMLRLAFLAVAAAVTGPALANSFAVLTIAALVLGLSSGALNVALSVQAVAVERALGRPVMAAMHGTWTFGAVTGGAAVSAGLRGGVDAPVLVTAGAVAAALAGLVLGRKLGEPRPSGTAAAVGAGTAAGTAPTATLRPGLVTALGIIGAVAFLTEGAATDWAGVHATRVLGAEPATASLAYTGFFAAMTVVRLVGDPIRGRLGAPVTVRLAGCTATAGYGLVLLAGGSPGPARMPVALLGWTLTGAGMALIWPVVTSALGAANVAAGTLSAVTTISYAGGLAGPALISYLAAAATLPVALLIPATSALALAIAAPAVLNAAARAAPRPGRRRPLERRQ
jgi:hypothetical protein